MTMMLAIFLCLMVSPTWALSDVPPSYLAESFAIQRSPETKILKVGGNLDETRFIWPNMPAKKRFFSRIRITNDGDHDVINPRLSINGFRIPLSSDELIENISHSSDDPLDRVLRTFYAMCYYSVHAAPNIDTRQNRFRIFYIIAMGYVIIGARFKPACGSCSVINGGIQGRIITRLQKWKSLVKPFI